MTQSHMFNTVFLQSMAELLAENYHNIWARKKKMDLEAKGRYNTTHPHTVFPKPFSCSVISTNFALLPLQDETKAWITVSVGDITVWYYTFGFFFPEKQNKKT